MTVAEICNGVTKDFKNNANIKAVIERTRDILSQYPERKLDRLWQKYLESWEGLSPPRSGTWAKWARELEVSKTDESVYYWRCGECGSLYDMVGMGCPSCGSQSATGVVAGSPDTPHLDTQPHCYQCKTYGKQEAHGPGCIAWGSQERPEALCARCACKECCDQEKMMREDPRLFRDLGAEGKLIDFLKDRDDPSSLDWGG